MRGTRAFAVALAFIVGAGTASLGLAAEADCQIYVDGEWTDTGTTSLASCLDDILVSAQPDAQGQRYGNWGNFGITGTADAFFSTIDHGATFKQIALIEGSDVTHVDEPALQDAVAPLVPPAAPPGDGAGDAALLELYRCHVFSYGSADFVREIKLYADETYDAWAISVGSWGVSGKGRYSAKGDGSTVFVGGPLAGAVSSDISEERPFASKLTIEAPGDDRGTICEAMYLGQ